MGLGALAGAVGGGARQVMEIKTSSDSFLVLGMEATEELGRLPEYRVRLVGDLDMLGSPKPVDMQDLLGTLATVTMKIDDDNPRPFSGYITRMSQGEQVGRYDSFTMTLRPWLWFATRTVDSYVFQAMSVKDIVDEVLTAYSTDYEFRLTGDYPPLDYCVQYQESDFDFVSRLLEYFGIYYFFEHKDSKHTMVIIDSMAKHKSKPISDSIRWANAMKYSWTAINWRAAQEARSQKTVVVDYDYLAPSSKIKGEETASNSTTKLGDSEVFEFTSGAVQNSIKDAAQADATSTAATQRATILMQELASLAVTRTGTTNTYDVAVGSTFTLEGHPRDDENDTYLVVSAKYRMEFADHEAIADLKAKRKPDGFVCDFVVQSLDDGDFRAARTTPVPRIHGPQTAIVVGASGNEIETDKHGRIKVQFQWDRVGKGDENSSCWVRVAQPWAGKGYGMFSLPRVGNEVVVQFLNGNPDRPLVTGSVYNSDNMMAWTLPDHSTFSGIKTQSSKGGGPDTANELRFEDKKDSEYIWFNAEKDFYRVVENDAFDHIGNNESVKVVLTRKEVIGENWFMDITKDVMHNMGKDLHVNVAGDIFYTGGATFQLKLTKDLSAKMDGDLGIEVGGKTQLKSKQDIALHSTDGKISLKSGKDPMTGSDILLEGANIKIKGATIVLEATSGITLKVGASLVNLAAAEVDIVGGMVKVNSGGGGGSASAGLVASPTAPTEAKKEDSITAEKQDDYDKTFEDPTADEQSSS